MRLPLIPRELKNLKEPHPNKFQVVIPRDAREKLGIARGDVLDVSVERGRLIYTPKSVIDRIPASKAERARFFKKLRDEAPAWLKEMWATSKRNGTDKITMREIDAEVAAVRRTLKKTNHRVR